MVGLRKAVGGGFKVVFGLLTVLGLLLIAALAWVSETSFADGRSILISPGTLIPAALVIWLLVRKRAKPPLSDGPQFSVVSGRYRQATDTVYPGLGATIELLADSLSITREGAASVVLHGLVGEKRISYASITATQFRGATPKTSGYIQFTILGGIESNRGIMDATKDENTVMFTHEQEGSFRRLRDAVERKVTEARQLASRPAALSVADELTKLAELKGKGILTDEEFAAQKAALIG